MAKIIPSPTIQKGANAAPGNKQVTLVRKLSQRKNREQFGKFVVEGERAVRQVLEAGHVPVDFVLVSQSFLDQLRDAAAPNWLVTDDKTFDDLSDTVQSQGILAVCTSVGRVKAEAILSSTSGVIVATDRIQDPGNLGTIVRTASWFNAVGILLGKGTVDYYNPKVVRSTAGAVDVLPHCECDLAQILDTAVSLGWEVYLLDLAENAKSLHNVEFGLKTILVAGNEASGIDAGLRESYQKLFIPGNHLHVESLNAGVSVALSLFEHNRQLNEAAGPGKFINSKQE